MNGIRYLRVHSQSHAADYDETLELRRQQFCMELGQRLLDDENLVFMDESTVRLDAQIK